jgi:two-component system, response regulator FlrC
MSANPAPRLISRAPFKETILNQTGKRKARILVVDDDPGLLRLLTIRLRAESYDVEAVESAAQALAASSRFRPDLVITDLRMDQMDGIGLLKELQNRWPGLKVIILTAHGTIPDAVQATQMGAFGFLTKPVDKQELLDQVQKALRISGFGASDEDWRAEIITRSASMEEKLAQAHMVAGTDARVLITGESGTGKELLARAIHRGSPRRNKAFVAINCSAMAEDLLESELFGHEKGSFTGAIARRIGKFEESSGGTLLLDEISEMDVRLQSKLLRAIQERVIDRVGGTRPVAVDIRIIATSNRNLGEAVREGTFREDLLFRLNVVNLKIPPLRERPADILELAQHFAKKYSDANGVPLRPLALEARRVLTTNRWQGNVRELENTLHRAVLMAQGDEIGPDAIITPDGDRLDLAKTAPAVAHATMAAEQVTRALVGRTVADVERDLILETLKHCLGNRTHAANILGISIRTLRNKLNEYADGGVPIPPAGNGDFQRMATTG